MNPRYNLNLSDLNSNQGNNASLLFSWGLDQTYRGNKITLDINGNIYIMGTKSIAGSFFYPIEAFIVKFDEFGEEIWNFTKNVEFDNYFNDISVDEEFNVYSFSNTYNDYWSMIKLNSTGNLVWNHTYKGTAECIYLDSYKNIYISGSTFLSKFDEFGTVLWNNSLPVSLGYPKILYVDRFNNTYSAGRYYYPSTQQFFYRIYDSFGNVTSNLIQNIELNYFSDNWFFDNLTSLYIIGSQDNGCCSLFKFNSTGALTQKINWQTEVFNDYTLGGCWSDVVVDSDGTIYCAGTNTFWSGESFSEVYLVKFNSSGDLEYDGAWKQRKSTSLGDLFVDKNNNVYLTGHWEYGVFVVINPSLGEFSKPGIFYMYIDEEIILYLSLFFGIWCLLGIILYIKFIKKKHDQP